MTTEIARPEGAAFDLLKAATTSIERYEAGQYAITPRPVPGFVHPVPPLFFDLPWNDDNDEIVAGILAGLVAADNIDDASQASELRDPYDLLGHPVEVLGIAAHRSDLDDAKWGAYLSLTCTVDGGPPEVINTGAGEVAVIMWRRFCEGRIPVRGSFIARGAAKQGRNQPLGFVIEEGF